MQNQDHISSGNEFCPPHQQRKIDNVHNNYKNLSLIMRFLNCWKTYLMNYIPLQEQERARCASGRAASIRIFAKSLEQYSNVKTQTSGESQPLEY